ncbi:tetratricopeptide repeat-containing sensor histidine kinase [Lutibacter sp.]
MKVLVFLLFPLIVLSQNSTKKQQLIKAIDSTTGVSEKTQLYIDLAWEYTITENDSALIFAEEALQFSKDNKYLLGQAMAIESKGLYEEIVTGNYDLASSYYIEGIKFCEQNNLTYATSIYHSLGVMFHSSDNYSKALEYYIIAYKRSKNENNIEVQKKCLINMGAIHSSLTHYNKAESLLLESLQLKIRKDLDYSTYANLGNLKIRQKKYKEAIPFLEKATQIHPNNPDSEEHLMYLIDAKVALHDSVNLQPVIHRAIAFKDKVKALRLKSNLTLSLSNYFSEFGDDKTALKYHKDYLEMFVKIKEKQRDQTVYDIEANYQTEKVQRDLDQKKAAQKLLFISLGAAAVLLLLVSFFLYKNRKKNLLLAKQKQMLEKTIGEKNILLRETHHRVKNSFQMVSSLLYLQSENVEDSEAKRAIKEAENRVRSMVLIHHKLYNKKQLIGIDTKEYIEDLTNDIFESHQSLSVHLKHQLIVESMILAVDTITPIGLILNELIINALKHAFDENTNNGLLEIQFFQQEKTLVLKVNDNGKGFVKKNNPQSFGLKLITALARKLEASVEINSDIGKGTEVIITITDFEIMS